MVQKLFWLIILRVCTALTEELLFMKAKAKNTSASAEAVELTSPIGRPTLIGAPIAGGAAEAAEAVEAGDGRRRTEDKEESFQGNKVPHSEDSAHVLFFCVCFCVCLFSFFFLCKKKSIFFVFFFFFFFFFRLLLPFSSSAYLFSSTFDTTSREKTEQHFATKGVVVFLFF